MPLVSIGMPVYNGARFVRQALDAILAQDFADMEIIISDNASSDESCDICEAYARSDKRIKVYRQAENIGAAKNYNFVFSKATGRYFKWAAHDDLIRKGFIARCIEEFEKADVAPVIVYPRAEFIDEAGAVIEPCDDRIMSTRGPASARLFHFTQSIVMSTPIGGLMDREIVSKTRLIDSFVGSDYVFLAEAILRGGIIRIDEHLFLRRLHEDMSRRANVTHQEVLQWFDPRATASRLSIRQKLYLEYYRSVLRCEAISALQKLQCCVALTAGIPLRRVRVEIGKIRRKLFRR